ncbi:MAG: 2-oxoacid:ferredoxin oxidoreductase subunit beta, partial [Francisellaceae bacterium]|nr:2-oxoacid:ferredoxin oxidoreductase subunit beta [Francisellaceae bacterium]
RNLDINVMLFNNRIYGLTKGQYSPTSKMGQLSRTSNNGVEDKELNPIEMALTAGATFVARAIDTEAKSLKEIITKANKHKGAAFIEILQNCNVYNDGVFAQIKDKKNQANSILRVEEGKPLIYGVEQEKGLVFNQETFSIETGHAQDSINYRNTKDDFLAKAIAKLDYPDFPVAIGVFKNTITKIFNEESKEQESEALLAKALDKQMTWKV